ncbi:4135_t:CDS:1 [Entrophospora sp. SA101]|nr:6682_t:CDS:1 [Entrophospora sp. SA101]CAJ0757379.1 4135_t:CDS:1 [Entrophospora sp. SA101]
MSDNINRDLVQWLEPRIFLLTEEKMQKAHFYYQWSSNNRDNPRKPYQHMTTLHQYLQNIGEYLLETEESEFEYVPKNVLCSAIDVLVTSASGNELSKAKLYCDLFNELTDQANSANKAFYDECDRAAADAAAQNQNRPNRSNDRDEDEFDIDSFIGGVQFSSNW